MNYYIADMHFYHDKILEYAKRPFKNLNEMHEVLIANWNRRVKARDNVYVLGDFAFCRGKRANELLDRLNGKKHLIVGNHDEFLKDKEFDKGKFVWIKDHAVIKDGEHEVVLFHFPIAVWQRRHYGSLHLYGHVHGDPRKAVFPLPQGNCANVSADYINFEPVTLKEALFK